MNADDFGCSLEINTAVIQAYRQGVLTSASLMVAESAAAQAVKMAKTEPGLAVGLHLVVAHGKSCLDQKRIPHLVDMRGKFRWGPFRAGLLCLFSPTVRKELADELRAQFDAFYATGLSLTHVDSHLHLHMHPVILRMILPLSVEYGASGLRLPHDDLSLAMAYNRRGWLLKAAWQVVFFCLGLGAKELASSFHLATAQRVYGLMQTGQMTEDYTLHLLDSIPVESAEIYFHPSLQAHGNPWGPNITDYRTLISPAIKEKIAVNGYRLANYASLGKVSSND